MRQNMRQGTRKVPGEYPKTPEEILEELLPSEEETSAQISDLLKEIIEEPPEASSSENYH